MAQHRPHGTGDPKVDAALGAAVRHLDATAREQERAVSRILGLVELLLETAHDPGTRARLEGILEACGFQDLCGQRLTKVNRFLRYLASNLEIPLDRPESQGESLVGPQANGLNQEQVDRLLRGEKL
jgi:chemotaxis regulatin CheY-phosphate phosphatase CheZ